MKKIDVLQVVIPVLLLFYPQWRSIKMLINYIYHQDENKLQTDKQTYEREVETLEPYLEAALQVS